MTKRLQLTIKDTDGITDVVVHPETEVGQIIDFPTSLPASDVPSWAKTGAGPTIPGTTVANVVETVQALGTISTTTTINCANGSIVTATLGAAIAIDITASASNSVCRVCTLILTNGGAYPITWNASIKWAGGVKPTLTSSGVDILNFMTIDNGTTWYGCLGGKGFA